MVSDPIEKARESGQASRASAAPRQLLRGVALSLLLLTPTVSLWAGNGAAIEVTARPEQLNGADRAQESVGDLLWRGGLALTSSTPQFGGFSGLLVSPDGSRLTAVSDKGHWLTASLRYDRDGRLAGFEEAAMGPLKEPDGKPLAGKSRKDAEALARLPDGQLLLAFERDHRLWRYGPGPQALADPPQPHPSPPGLQALSGNHGIEALVSLAGGEILAIAQENLPHQVYPAFLWTGEAWPDLSFQAVEGHEPSGATLLPNGDLLLIERRSDKSGGISLRLGRIPASEVRPGAQLRSREIARLLPPLTVDNMEAVTAWQGPTGETLVALISDDNFSPQQRSLLLLFQLQE